MERDRERAIPDIEAVEFTEERLGSLYAALGNNEAKAITFLAMKPGVIYDDNDIVTAVRNAQGNTQKGWKMGNEGPFHYLQKSFAPVGLVAQEVTDRHDNSYGYIRTDWGNAIGEAFAGKMLQLSHANPEISLYDLFGSTVSTSRSSTDLKKRSPLTRISLFRELLSSGDQGVAGSDLAGKIGESDVSLLYRHVRDLSRIGIISVDENKRISVPHHMQELLFTVVRDFQNLLDLDSATLEEGRIFAAQLMTSPDAVAALMKKAKEHSRNANQTPVSQTALEIETIIAEKPGITTSQVRDALEVQYGQVLSEHRVRRIINQKMDELGIRPKRIGKTITWSESNN